MNKINDHWWAHKCTYDMDLYRIVSDSDNTIIWICRHTQSQGSRRADRAGWTLALQLRPCCSKSKKAKDRSEDVGQSCGRTHRYHTQCAKGNRFSEQVAQADHHHRGPPGVDIAAIKETQFVPILAQHNNFELRRGGGCEHGNARLKRALRIVTTYHAARFNVCHLLHAQQFSTHKQTHPTPVRSLHTIRTAAWLPCILPLCFTF